MLHFYCAMQGAFRGIATVSRLSVHPSGTLMYRGRMCWVSSKLIPRIISLALRSSEPQHRQSSPRGTPPNSGGIGMGSLFSAENLQYLWNGVRFDQCYYWWLIASCIRAFDWYQNQLRWMTRTAILHYVSKYMPFRSPPGKFQWS